MLWPEREVQLSGCFQELISGSRFETVGFGGDAILNFSLRVLFIIVGVATSRTRFQALDSFAMFNLQLATLRPSKLHRMSLSSLPGKFTEAMDQARRAQESFRFRVEVRRSAVRNLGLELMLWYVFH